MTNIFEKIIKRKVPAEIVYEDDYTIVFLDINPVNYGHSLIVPKKYFKNILDADDDSLNRMIKVAKKISLALIETNLAEGVNIIMNNETAANQQVLHAHIHVVPRLAEDNVYQKPRHTSYSGNEAKTVCEKIKSAM